LVLRIFHIFRAEDEHWFACDFDCVTVLPCYLPRHVVCGRQMLLRKIADLERIDLRPMHGSQHVIVSLLRLGKPRSDFGDVISHTWVVTRLQDLGGRPCHDQRIRGAINKIRQRGDV
jgi:hypothetical protein